MLGAIHFFISSLIGIYIWIIIIWVILGWLLTLNVINPQNQFVRSIYIGLNNLCEPALKPIRKLLPDLGGLDISPIILIVGLQALNILLRNILVRGQFF